MNSPCSMVRRFPAIVQTGKYGDLICMLPLFKAIYDKTAERPRVIVERQYADLFDGVSYVDAISTDFLWNTGTPAARRWAENEFGSCIVPMFWNDPANPANVPPGDIRISLHGVDWNIDGGQWPDYMAAMWARLGFDPKLVGKMPIVFDRRDPGREALLIKKYIQPTKPNVLVNFRSGSSPFVHEPEVWGALRNLGINIVHLSEIKAHRIYDLIGLFEVADGLINCATATLQLCGAVRTPHIAFTEDTWSRAVPPGNCVLNIPYSQAVSRKGEVEAMVSRWARRNRMLAHIDHDNPPKIADQTPWEGGIFDFSKSSLPLRPGVDYFNCGAARVNNHDWLIVRRSQQKKGNPFGMNDLVSFRLDGVRPGEAVAVQVPRKFNDEHFEDPRAFQNGNSIYISCTNFIWGPPATHAHQLFMEADIGWSVQKRFDPVYGRNGPGVTQNSGPEKNWTWFFHGGRPFATYRIHPHIVVRFNQRVVADSLYETRPHNWQWQWGEPRGGTPPVLVDGLMWSFFHSSADNRTRQMRQYYMGAYAFEPRPPFEIRRYSPKPILFGGTLDRWFPGKPMVVFPCGAIFDGDRWLVTMGLNDLDCGWIRIPHEDLIEATQEISHSVNRKQNRVLC